MMSWRLKLVYSISGIGHLDLISLILKNFFTKRNSILTHIEFGTRQSQANTGSGDPIFWIQTRTGKRYEATHDH